MKVKNRSASRTAFEREISAPAQIAALRRSLYDTQRELTRFRNLVFGDEEKDG